MIHYPKTGQFQSEIIDPATKRIIGYSPIHDKQEIIDAIRLSRKAQIEWNEYTIEERIEFLEDVKFFLIDNQDLLAESISADTGKSVYDALSAEVLPSIIATNYYLSNAKKFLKQESVKSANPFLFNKKSSILRKPYGVIGIISPWNYPFTIPYSEVLVALLSGNGVVLKVATETQSTGLFLKKCFNDLDIPKGLFQYINVPGKSAGDVLIENGIDKLFFTGSTRSGKYLMKKASETLTPITLELGGNDSMIVCDDADLNKSIKGAVWGAFHNAGQSCGGIERIYVHESLYESFLSGLKSEIEKLRFGYGSNFNSDIGCLTSELQIRTVENHIEDALSKGAKLFVETKLNNDPELFNFLPARVFIDVDENMLMVKEESFGPIVGVMKFSSLKDAVRGANSSSYGLTASVWTKNKSVANQLAKELKAGVISVNDHLMTHGMPETPWGGIKNSGFGRTHGKFAFEEMTYPVAFVEDYFNFQKQNLWWYPASKEKYEALKAIPKVLYNFDLSQLKQLFKVLPKLFK